MLVKVGIILILLIGLIFFFWPGYPPNQFLMSFISKGSPQQQQVNNPQKDTGLENHQMPNLLNIEFKDGVDKGDETEMRKGFKLMDFTLNKLFGHSITKKSAIRVEASSSDSKFLDENGTITFVYQVLSQDWLLPKKIGSQYNMDMRSRAAAHEYIHLYQINEGCANLGSEGEKAKWFLEGVAEWLSYKAMEESGNLPFGFDGKKMILMQFQMGGGNVKLLNSYEKEISTDVSLYGYFALAVDYLVENTNIKALDNYCANIGKGQELSVAFQNAFGISLEKFYSDFEVYRKSL
ncbi:hypothetical protein HYS91_05660 [Candidatus Daviesbacteria bacterium]|nr:hypothetical protein [Candidatus Daviesbacteria bacterium]